MAKIKTCIEAYDFIKEIFPDSHLTVVETTEDQRKIELDAFKERAIHGIWRRIKTEPEEDK